MEIDIGRWTSLQAAERDARSDLRGCTERLRAAQADWLEARSRREVLAGDAAHRSPRPDVASAAEQSLNEQDRLLAAARGEVERLEQRQVLLGGRFDELSRIARECRSWARQAGINLPGGDDGPAAVRVAGTGGEARHFVGDLGPAPAASPAAPAPEYVGRVSNGSTRPRMFGGVS